MAKYMKLYASTRDAVEVLNDVEAGKLFKSLLRYMNGDEPVEMTGGDKILYCVLKNQLDRETQVTYRRGIPSEK